MAVAVSRGQEPVLLNRTNTAAEAVDYTGWFTDRKCHYIPVPLSTSPLFLSVFLFWSNLPQTATIYELQVLTTPSPLCPSSCSGHGSCLGDTCACTGGYFDVDCARVLPVLQPSERVSLTVSRSHPVLLFVSLGCHWTGQSGQAMCWCSLQEALTSGCCFHPPSEVYRQQEAPWELQLPVSSHGVFVLVEGCAGNETVDASCPQAAKGTK